MRILAMDTSNSTCCAGLYDGDKELSYKLSFEKRTHSETFMPLVHEVMQENGLKHSDLDAYAVTVGPGSFTGIRIGLSFVKGMAAASDVKCIPVSSVEALARSVDPVDTPKDKTIFISCFEARNNRVFAGVFTADNYMRLIPDNAYNADDLIAILRKMTIIGDMNFIVIGDGSNTVNKAINNSDFCTEVLSVNYAPGAVILPKGIYGAAKKLIDNLYEPVSALNLEPMYCAKAQAERLRIKYNPAND
ncbi:MAG: tRNA (adenosine(37)-N6)-threonylcarbamoyltransferase complex dimerization subunit type 1 TsaB [Clostridia bacterium]|nr:tRNA (adenosine(37)-N6)-threonylcarbamoyltransferase complex dimerization subunit type 1 TsaB [Clostridia bacterium]